MASGHDPRYLLACTICITTAASEAILDASFSPSLGVASYRTNDVIVRGAAIIAAGANRVYAAVRL